MDAERRRWIQKQTALIAEVRKVNMALLAELHTQGKSEIKLAGLDQPLTVSESIVERGSTLLERAESLHDIVESMCTLMEIERQLVLLTRCRAGC